MRSKLLGWLLWAGLCVGAALPVLGEGAWRPMQFDLQGPQDNVICLGCHDGRTIWRGGRESWAARVDAKALAES
ncbi:MAG: hypothetical protein QHJ73_06925, partial [Armatimonadota bacterium]|nr:hypothetical protein [Armatimonadota bacterium]